MESKSNPGQGSEESHDETGRTSVAGNSQAASRGGVSVIGTGSTRTILLFLAAFLVIFVVGVTVGGMQWWLFSQYRKEQPADRQPGPLQSTKQNDVPESTRQSDAPADGASKALSQRVATAAPEERQPVAEALALAENTYPTDYRFPFEHAKLVVSGSGHHHAFGLLFLAAQRAIDANQADQLYVEVAKEKDGAFYRCARGHQEWKMLEDALKTKDKSALESAMATMHRDLIGGADNMAMDY